MFGMRNGKDFCRIGRIVQSIVECFLLRQLQCLNRIFQTDCLACFMVQIFRCKGLYIQKLICHCIGIQIVIQDVAVQGFDIIPAPCAKNGRLLADKRKKRLVCLRKMGLSGEHLRTNPRNFFHEGVQTGINLRRNHAIKGIQLLKVFIQLHRPNLNNLKGTFRVRLHLLSGFEGERLIEFQIQNNVIHRKKLLYRKLPPGSSRLF